MQELIRHDLDVPTSKWVVVERSRLTGSATEHALSMPWTRS
jgi:hypothetical protein